MQSIHKLLFSVKDKTREIWVINKVTSEWSFNSLLLLALDKSNSHPLLLEQVFHPLSLNSHRLDKGSKPLQNISFPSFNFRPTNFFKSLTLVSSLKKNKNNVVLVYLPKELLHDVISYSSVFHERTSRKCILWVTDLLSLEPLQYMQTSKLALLGGGGPCNWIPAL